MNLYLRAKILYQKKKKFDVDNFLFSLTSEKSCIHLGG